MTYFILFFGYLLSFNEYSDTYRLDKGQNFVFGLYPYALEVNVSDKNEASFLTDKGLEALNVTPAWIKDALFDTLSRLSPEKADMIAEIILQANSENPCYTDEVAFVAAHLPVEDINFDDQTFKSSFNPELLLENVRGIYEAAGKLAYVELIEFGDDGECSKTTVELTMKDGVKWQAPYEYYYWYVVHPRLTDDSALYINPHSGNPKNIEDGGRFWRTYFMTGTPDPDYRKPAILKFKNEINDFSSFSAHDGIELSDQDPVVAIKNSDDVAVLLHIAFGKGMIFATTLDFQSADDPLLENLMHTGFGYGAILEPYMNKTFAVLRDKPSFGNTLIEDALDAAGFAYDVLDSTDINNLTAEEDLASYYKIIVPADQTPGFYALIESKSEIFENKISNTAGSTFIFFGARDASSEDWDNYNLPFGIARVDIASQSFIAGGFPDWNQVLALDAAAAGNYVWDGETYNDISGARKYSEDDMLLDRLGYLVSQTLEMRVGEIPHLEYMGPDGDCHDCVVRSAYPQRIAYQHYGNCGELQDLGAAFGRTSLIPSAGVGGITEDHVWNEFYLNDQWVPFQVDWSDGATRIAVPGNAQDKDYGGGKDLAIVYRTRPDGKWENVTDRYSNTVSLNFTITDDDDNPVPGAEILVASENWYDPSQLTLAIVIHTDDQGKATLKVGDFQNIYVRASYGENAWPDPETVSLVLCEDEGTLINGGTCPSKAPWDSDTDMPLGNGSSDSYDIPLKIGGHRDIAPSVSVVEDTSSDIRAEFKYTINTSAMQAQHLDTLGSTFTDNWQTAEPPVFYVMDEENLNRYLEGNDATAVAELTADDAEHTLLLSGVKPWYVTASNIGNGDISEYFEISMKLEKHETETEEPENNDDDSSGCGCYENSQNSKNSTPILFGFMLMLFFVFKHKVYPSKNR